MKLYGSVTSPFVRSVRIVANELRVEHEFIEIGPFGKETPEQRSLLKEHNPLIRVPVLVDNDQVVFESRIICNYLLERAGSCPASFRAQYPLSFPEENIISTIQGAIESCTIPFMITRSDADIKAEGGYFERFRQRTQASFDWLNKQLAVRPSYFGNKFGVSEAFMIAALEWMQKRQAFDWSEYEKIVDFHHRFLDRESVVKTRIPETV